LIKHRALRRTERALAIENIVSPTLILEDERFLFTGMIVNTGENMISDALIITVDLEPPRGPSKPLSN